MYNSSLVMYDISSKSTTIVNLQGITHTGNDNFTQYHVDGIDYDPKSGHTFVAASDSTAFDSTISQGAGGGISTNYSHANYTGVNRIVVFDPEAATIVADVSREPVQEAFHSVAGHLTSGFQDMAEIEYTGDSYAIGTFGSSVAKIPYGSKTSELWYSPKLYNISYGFSGVVSVGHKLVISADTSGGLVTFDTTQRDPQPTYVPLQNFPPNYRPSNADGLYAPRRYGGKVVLWSDDYNGASVYGSTDDWASAHYLGLISNDDPGIYEGALTTGSFEVGDRVFVATLATS